MATVRIDTVAYPDASVEWTRTYDQVTERDAVVASVACAIHIPSAHLEGEVVVEYEGHGSARGIASVVEIPDSFGLKTVVEVIEPFQSTAETAGTE